MDPLHEVAYKIFEELDAIGVELKKGGWSEITVWKKTKDVDVASTLRKYGFDVRDCYIKGPILYQGNCIGGFSGQINGKPVRGVIFYDEYKEMVYYIRMFYFSPPSGGQA